MKQYVEYLKKSDEVETIFDHTERRLFEAIAIRWVEGNYMTVTEAMQLNFVASPATIHRKLDHLLLTGYVKAEYKNNNKRTKYLALTNWGVNYLNLKARLMRRAMQEAANETKA